jgi:hypothetical protein
MKLTLTTDDGEVLDQWHIEQDFGDVTKTMPAQVMKNELVHEIAKRQQIEAAIKAYPPSTERCDDHYDMEGRRCKLRKYHEGKHEFND